MTFSLILFQVYHYGMMENIKKNETFAQKLAKEDEKMVR
jgi:hypothetical protein